VVAEVDNSFFHQLNNPVFINNLFSASKLSDDDVKRLLSSALGRIVSDEELQVRLFLCGKKIATLFKHLFLSKTKSKSSILRIPMVTPICRWQK
jgi:hypothetical protein